MLLTHFVHGKFTRQSAIEQRTGHDAGYRVLASDPAQTDEWYADIQAAVYRYEAEVGIWNRDTVGQLFFEYQSNWVYALLLRTGADKYGRAIKAFHAVLLTEKELTLLGWNPWILKEYLVEDVGSASLEGRVPGLDRVSPETVPVNLPIEVNVPDLTTSSSEAAERLAAALAEAPVCLTQCSMEAYVEELIAATIRSLKVRGRPIPNVAVNVPVRDRVGKSGPILIRLLATRGDCNATFDGWKCLPVDSFEMKPAVEPTTDFASAPPRIQDLIPVPSEHSTGSRPLNEQTSAESGTDLKVNTESELETVRTPINVTRVESSAELPGLPEVVFPTQPKRPHPHLALAIVGWCAALSLAAYAFFIAPKVYQDQNHERLNRVSEENRRLIEDKRLLTLQNETLARSVKTLELNTREISGLATFDIKPVGSETPPKGKLVSYRWEADNGDKFKMYVAPNGQGPNPLDPLLKMMEKIKKPNIEKEQNRR